MKASDCIKNISAISDHSELKTFWEKILAKNTPSWPSGLAFEYMILRAFELEGASITWPYEVILFDEKVEQIDGAIHLEHLGLTALFETKDYPNDNINIEPIAKLRNQLLRRPSGCIGSVFCTKGFTEPAITLAHFLQPHSIILWEKDNIEHCIDNECFIQGFLLKHKMNITHGLPNFDITI